MIDTGRANIGGLDDQSPQPPKEAVTPQPAETVGAVVPPTVSLPSPPAHLPEADPGDLLDRICDAMSRCGIEMGAWEALYSAAWASLAQRGAAHGRESIPAHLSPQELQEMTIFEIQAATVRLLLEPYQWPGVDPLLIRLVAMASWVE